MKIYIVEVICDYVTQIGASTSQKIAEAKAKELTKQSKYHHYFVTEYDINNNWTKFSGD